MDFSGLVSDPRVITISGLSVAITLGLVQIAKPFVADVRWHSVLALVFAVLFNVGVAFVWGTPPAEQAVLGVVAGLVASGTYSFGHSTAYGVRAVWSGRARGE